MRKDEFEFEFIIRGVFTSRVVQGKRNILLKLLSKEISKPGLLIDMNKYQVGRNNESVAITATLESITTCIVEFDCTITDFLFKVITSKINHVIDRIMRTKCIHTDPVDAS